MKLAPLIITLHAESMRIPVLPILPCIWTRISCHIPNYLLYSLMIACGYPRENPAPPACRVATTSSKRVVPCACCTVPAWPVDGQSAADLAQLYTLRPLTHMGKATCKENLCSHVECELRKVYGISSQCVTLAYVQS